MGTIISKNIDGRNLYMKQKLMLIVFSTAAATLLLACATRQPAIVTEPPTSIASIQANQEYVIQPGDQLDIKLFYNPELNETVSVRPDGMISLQLIDDMKAAGLKPSELDEEITARYSAELQKPMVTVIVRSFTGQRVYVGGEVNTQGLFDFTAGMTPLQAVLNAGGFKETANPTAALIIRKGSENRPVPIRVNLKENLNGIDGALLQPQDVVYVPKTFIAEANKFVNQYIEKLFLFRGVSLGFSYELNNDFDIRR
ncbi:MAG: sugar transporter [Deltaproteobacteria bacterium HGW-Deltaproteobacteria-15]|nr:MAG: sugar transporter [Deltaproteobacteria bacterium HGW-Deltaproteobacteria-15]